MPTKRPPRPPISPTIMARRVIWASLFGRMVQRFITSILLQHAADDLIPPDGPIRRSGVWLALSRYLTRPHARAIPTCAAAMARRRRERETRDAEQWARSLPRYEYELGALSLDSVSPSELPRSLGLTWLPRRLRARTWLERRLAWRPNELSAALHAASLPTALFRADVDVNWPAWAGSCATSPRRSDRDSIGAMRVGAIETSAFREEYHCLTPHRGESLSIFRVNGHGAIQSGSFSQGSYGVRTGSELEVGCPVAIRPGGALSGGYRP